MRHECGRHTPGTFAPSHDAHNPALTHACATRPHTAFVPRSYRRVRTACVLRRRFMLYRITRDTMAWSFDTLTHAQTMTYYVDAYLQSFLLMIGNDIGPLVRRALEGFPRVLA
jgi:hypothetical protein